MLAAEGLYLTQTQDVFCCLCQFLLLFTFSLESDVSTVRGAVGGGRALTYRGNETLMLHGF